jgi:hypothetical protein
MENNIKNSESGLNKKKNTRNRSSSTNSKLLSLLGENTLNLIESIERKNYLCIFCNDEILNYEIYSCENCFKIFHLECVKTNLNKIKFSVVTKYSFDCPCCVDHQKIFDIFPVYNCYCGKYLTSKKECINESLIPHGCGQTCAKVVCQHLKCSWPCHPGHHETCKECHGKEYMTNLKVEKQNKPKDSSKQTSIINLKGKIKEVGPSCEYDLDLVYCGRAIFMGGWRLPASIWANPFKVSEYETNEIVCEKYENYLRSKEDLLKRLPELVGKKLACWCSPNPCHTEILLKLIKERGLI